MSATPQRLSYPVSLAFQSLSHVGTGAAQVLRGVSRQNVAFEQMTGPYPKKARRSALAVRRQTLRTASLQHLRLQAGYETRSGS